MTFPVYFHVAGLGISAHQVLEVAAYAAGFALYLHLRRRWPLGPKMTVEQTAWVMVGAIFGALLGAKLLAWVESFPLYWAHRTDWHILLGGKTIVGAITGGWAGVQIAKRCLGISHPNGDIYVFPLILGVCIGRVGCFLAGLEDHTYGIATTLPWGVDFGDGARHPTQLYEIVFLLVAAGVFVFRIRTGRQRGCMFSQFLFAYLGWRFAVEFIKPRYTLPVVPLSAIQLAALTGMVFTFLHRNDQCCGRAVSQPQNHDGDARGGCRGQATAGANIDAPCCASAEAGSTCVELTGSLCPMCLQKIDARIIIDAGRVYLQKFCPDHGPQRVLIADDAAYWQKSRSLYSRPATPPKRRNTEMRRGCPWDCGICPDHDQHTCLAIVEITDQCDLGCPICYAGSGTGGQHRTLSQVEAMLDSVVANEGNVGVVQISGGEPTLHPKLFAVLDAVKARPIRHLMLNTNGRRLAEDPELARRLASYMPGFEVYLQFDSLRPEALRQLRGRDLSDIRRRALEALNRHNVSTTLVVTLKKGVNDQEIGEILEFAAAQPCVRGVTFQPIQAAGRLHGFDPATHRLTLTEVRSAILRQSKLFTPQDLVPVPCHPDALTLGYAIRRGQTLVPLSKWIDLQSLLDLGGNTICYEQDPNVRQNVQRLFAAGPAPATSAAASASPASLAQQLKLQCCAPFLPGKGSPIAYDNVFRVIIMQFMDAWSMDLRSLKRSCVHVVDPDGRLVPFETYNLLHRHRAAEMGTSGRDVVPTQHEGSLQ